MVPEAGIEPARPQGHRILNPARLPVPPLWQIYGVSSGRDGAKCCDMAIKCQAENRS